jgi:hypothetical protein
MARSPNAVENPKSPRTARDIVGFTQRPLTEQIATILGRVDALSRTVGKLEDTLDGLFVEYALEYPQVQRAEPVETIGELLEVVLTMEARVTALKDGMDLLFLALDRDGPLGQEQREIESIRISKDLGLPPVGKR